MKTNTPRRSTGSRWLAALWILAFLSLPALAFANNFLVNGVASNTGLPLPSTKINVPNAPTLPANEQVTAVEFNTVTGALTDVEQMFQDGGLLSNPYLGTIVADAGVLGTAVATTVSADGGFFGNVTISGSCTGTACGIAIPYQGALVADGGVFSKVSADGGFFNSLQGGTGFANTITVGGSATTVDPTITAAGDATRSLSIVVPAATNTTIAGLGISNSAGGGPVFIGSGFNAGYGAIWLGATSATASGANYSLQNNLSTLFINGPSAGGIQFYIAAATNVMNLTTASMSLNGLSILQSAAASPLTLKGNPAATGGVGVVLDNQINQTAGRIVSIRNNAVEKAYFDFSGNAFVNTAIQAITSGALTVAGNAASAGTAVIASNAIDVGATGIGFEVAENSANQFAVSGRGHLIAQGTVPTAGSYAAGLGSVTATSVTGADASMRINFTTGTVTSVAIGTPIFVVTLANAYSAAATANAIAAWATAPSGTVVESPLTAVFTAANQVSVYATSGATFVPASTQAYSVSLITMGAGATY